MLRLEILPRLIPDSYHDTWDEAVRESMERRTNPIAADGLTRMDRSPYGGYRVYTVSRTVAMKFFTYVADPRLMFGSRDDAGAAYPEEVP